MSNIGSWETIKIVGKGGSSTVFKARLTDSGRLVAVKQIETDGMTKEQLLSLKAEIETMKGLSHPNIISFLGFQQASNKFSIVLEYAERGSLRQYYQKKGPLKEIQASNCVRQIVLGLQYLHDNGIAHRDVKCANCLLSKQGGVKLADFGASKRFDSESIVSGLKGTPNWMAPEVIRGTQMTTGWMKADIWSLGCTVVEMMTAKLPFSEYDNPMTAMYHIANGKAPSLRKTNPEDNEPFSPEISSFVALCCSSDPTNRPDTKDLLSHPFVLKKDKSSKRDIDSISSDSPDSQSLVVEGKSVTLGESHSQSLNDNSQNRNTSNNPVDVNRTAINFTPGTSSSHIVSDNNCDKEAVPQNIDNDNEKLEEYEYYEDDFEDAIDETNASVDCSQPVDYSEAAFPRKRCDSELEQSATLAAGTLSVHLKCPSYDSQDPVIIPPRLEDMETPVINNGRKKFFPETSSTTASASSNSSFSSKSVNNKSSAGSSIASSVNNGSVKSIRKQSKEKISASTLSSVSSSISSIPSSLVCSSDKTNVINVNNSGNMDLPIKSNPTEDSKKDDVKDESILLSSNHISEFVSEEDNYEPINSLRPLSKLSEILKTIDILTDDQPKSSGDEPSPSYQYSSPVLTCNRVASVENRVDSSIDSSLLGYGDMTSEPLLFKEKEKVRYDDELDTSSNSFLFPQKVSISFFISTVLLF